jgi:hypothetical protein
MGARRAGPQLAATKPNGACWLTDPVFPERGSPVRAD